MENPSGLFLKTCSLPGSAPSFLQTRAPPSDPRGLRTAPDLGSSLPQALSFAPLQYTMALQIATERVLWLFQAG